MLADAIAHVVAVILISGAILLVGAIVLHPSGTKITAPAQLGELLVPFWARRRRLSWELHCLQPVFHPY